MEAIEVVDSTVAVSEEDGSDGEKNTHSECGPIDTTNTINTIESDLIQAECSPLVSESLMGREENQNPTTFKLEGVRSSKGYRMDYFGHFDDAGKALDCIRDKAESFEGVSVYCLLNPAVSNNRARYENSLFPVRKGRLPSEKEIKSRIRLNVRIHTCYEHVPSGFGAELALVADQVTAFLHSMNFPDPLRIDGGEEIQLLYGIRLKAAPKSTALISGILKALNAKFSTVVVKVDTDKYHALEWINLPEVLSKEQIPGEESLGSTSIFPRLENLEAVHEEALAEVAKLAPRKNRHRPGSGTAIAMLEPRAVGTVRQAIQGMVYSENHRQDGSTVFHLKVCPLDPIHGETTILVTTYAVTFFCNSCGRTLWRVVKKALREGKNQTPTSPPSSPGACLPVDRGDILGEADPYFVTRKGVYFKKVGKRATEYIKASNFGALITESKIRDDGTTKNLSYELTWFFEGQTGVIRLEEKEFDCMNWTNQIGLRAVILGTSNKDKVRTAIRLNSKQCSRTRIFTHTGWRLIDNQMYYLNQGGAIGSAGLAPHIKVVLPESFQDYKLPPPPERAELIKAIRNSMQILDIVPDEIGIPLYSQIWRAVVSQTSYSVHCAGSTGNGKSCMTALCVQHYGEKWHCKHLPGSWSSTENALCESAFLLKDILFVVDDFHPSLGSEEKRRLISAADRLFRNVGNSSARCRLGTDKTIGTAREPRGTILSSGEDIPPGHSLRARLIILEFHADSVNWERLTKSQVHASEGWFVKAMSGYVQWIASNLEIHLRRIQKVHDKLLPKLPACHKRTPDNIADLAAGLICFIEFAIEKGALSRQEAEIFWERAWQALQKVAKYQADYQDDSNPALQFFELLKSALDSGRAHLCNLKGEVPDTPTTWGWCSSSVEEIKYLAQGDQIGAVDGQNVFLYPLSSYSVVQRLAGVSSNGLPPPKTLWQQIKDSGLLLTTTEERGNRLEKRIGGDKKYVLHVHANLLGRGENERGQREQQCNIVNLDELLSSKAEFEIENETGTGANGGR